MEYPHLRQVYLSNPGPCSIAMLAYKKNGVVDALEVQPTKQRIVFRIIQGIVGCTPTNVPLWEIPIYPYIVGVYGLLSPRIPIFSPYKYHGYTVRGTPNCRLNYPWIKDSLLTTNSAKFGFWTFLGLRLRFSGSATYSFTGPFSIF